MVLLQAAPGGGMSGLYNIGLILVLIIIFYFFMIRPQQKQQKKIAAARAALKPGDKIITAGGIHGTIKEINAATNLVTIEVWENVKMKVDMNQIYSLEQPTTEKK